MNNLYLGLKFALSYFTVIPIKFKEEDDLSKKQVLNMMLITLPFIGLILSTITLILNSFLDSIPLLAAIISSCIYMILYGFIHIEAIVDIVDAVYAKHGGKDAYKIIKESTIGAMGFLYALIFVIVKISALSYLLYNEFFLEFIAIAIISRISILFAIYFFEFRSSFITLLKKSFSSKGFLFSIIFYSLIVSILIDLNFALFILLAFCLCFLIANFLKRNVGFLNGDALGTILEIIEIILFMLVCYLWL